MKHPKKKLHKTSTFFFHYKHAMKMDFFKKRENCSENHENNAQFLLRFFKQKKLSKNITFIF